MIDKPPKPISPFVGIRPFCASDNFVFFGREQHTVALLGRLDKSPFVAVVGSSGCGKSSLVHAGLIPALNRGYLLDCEDWQVYRMTPGRRPYLRLLRTLDRGPSSDTGSEHVDDIEPTKEERERLADILLCEQTPRAILQASGKLADKPVLILVDQFEELFRFRRRLSDDKQRELDDLRHEASMFAKMLISGDFDSDPPIRVIVTMRSDFIGDCDAFLGLPEAVSRNQFLIPRLNREQLTDAIESPAKRSTRGYFPFTFQQHLVNHIINEAGDRPDHLPLAQHALLRAWQRMIDSGSEDLTYDHYDAAGGVKGSLSQHADEIFQNHLRDPGDELIAKRMFLLLCDSGSEGQLIRRQPTVKEVMSVTGASLAKVMSIVQCFQREDCTFILPLVSKGHFTEETHLDVCHEALLRNWEQLRKWREVEERHVASYRQFQDYLDAKEKVLKGKLLTRAIEWRNELNPNSAWAERYDAGRSVDRATFDDVIRMIDRSRRQRFIVGFSYAAISGIIILGIIWVTVVYIGLLQRVKTARVTNYSRTIGSTESVFAPSGERDSLWEVAAIEPAQVEVRKELLERWMEDADKLQGGVRRQAQGLRAALGLNLSLRQNLQRKAYGLVGTPTSPSRFSERDFLSELDPDATATKKIAESCFAKSINYLVSNANSYNDVAMQQAVGVIRQTSPLVTEETLGNAGEILVRNLDGAPYIRADQVEGTIVLSGHLPEDARRSLLIRVFKVLLVHPHNYQSRNQMRRLLSVLPPSNQANELSQVLECFVTVAISPIDPEGSVPSFFKGEVQQQLVTSENECNMIANRLMRRLEDPANLSQSQADLLRVLFEYLAPRLSAATADDIAARLFVAMQSPANPPSENLRSLLASALLAVSNETSTVGARSLSQQITDTLLDKEKKSTLLDRNLCLILPLLIQHLDPPEVDEIALRIEQFLVKNPENNLKTRLQVSRALAAISLYCSDECFKQFASTEVDRLIQFYGDDKRIDGSDLAWIDNGLADLAINLSDELRDHTSNQLLELLKTSNWSTAEPIESIDTVLLRLAQRMPAEEANTLAESLFDLSQAHFADNLAQEVELLFTTSKIVNLLSTGKDKILARKIMEHLSVTLLRTANTDPTLLTKIDNTLKELAWCLNTDDANRNFEELLGALITQEDDNTHKFHSLSAVLEALVKYIDDDMARTGFKEIGIAIDSIPVPTRDAKEAPDKLVNYYRVGFLGMVSASLRERLSAEDASKDSLQQAHQIMKFLQPGNIRGSEWWRTTLPDPNATLITSVTKICSFSESEAKLAFIDLLLKDLLKEEESYYELQAKRENLVVLDFDEAQKKVRDENLRLSKQSLYVSQLGYLFSHLVPQLTDEDRHKLGTSINLGLNRKDIAASSIKHFLRAQLVLCVRGLERKPKLASDLVIPRVEELSTSKAASARQVASLGRYLCLMCENIPKARQTYRFALASALATNSESRPEDPGFDATGWLYRNPEDQTSPEERANTEAVVETWCQHASPEELLDVLKWPFCTGEVQRIVITSLENKVNQGGNTRFSFHDSIWKVCEHVDEIAPGTSGPIVNPFIYELKELKTELNGLE
ncbi:hypothetical protein GC197_06625 [bacterium]|nr:hypothetical protein [bacterium]